MASQRPEEPTFILAVALGAHSHVLSGMYDDLKDTMGEALGRRAAVRLHLIQSHTLCETFFVALA